MFALVWTLHCEHPHLLDFLGGLVSRLSYPHTLIEIIQSYTSYIISSVAPMKAKLKLQWPPLCPGGKESDI